MKTTNSISLKNYDFEFYPLCFTFIRTTHLSGSSALRYPTPDDHYGPAGQVLNPILSIWLRPRATIRSLLNRPSPLWFFVLLGLYGFINVLQSGENNHVGDQISSLSEFLAASLLIGPPIALASTYIGGYVIERGGRRLGGRASQADLRLALVWSYAPLILSGLMYYPRLSAFGGQIFTSSFQKGRWGDLSGPLMTLELANLAVVILTTVWSLILLSHMVAQVQGYASAWRGFGNILLGVLYIIAAAVIVFGAAFLLAKISGQV
jgi:hypothetical protein